MKTLPYLYNMNETELKALQQEFITALADKEIYIEYDERVSESVKNEMYNIRPDGYLGWKVHYQFNCLNNQGYYNQGYKQTADFYEVGSVICPFAR